MRLKRRREQTHVSREVEEVLDRLAVQRPVEPSGVVDAEPDPPGYSHFWGGKSLRAPSGRVTVSMD